TRADGRPRDRLLAVPRGRPPGRGAARPGAVGAGRTRPAGPRAGVVRLALLVRLDLVDPGRLLVGGPPRDRFHAGPDGGGEPAPAVRVPGQPHRPAPVPVDPGAGLRRHRAPAVPRSAVGGAAPALVAALPTVPGAAGGGRRDPPAAARPP